MQRLDRLSIGRTVLGAYRLTKSDQPQLDLEVRTRTHRRTLQLPAQSLPRLHLLHGHMLPLGDLALQKSFMLGSEQARA